MSERVCIIAEAGVNHNGDPGRALEMVDAAADAGADAVKFQTFDPAALVTAQAAQAEYQVRNDGDHGGQLAMLRGLVLEPRDHHRVAAHCAKRGIAFLSSPFDPGSARFLVEEMGLRLIKLGSGELTNAPLLYQLGRSGCELILSTGMANLNEISGALGVLASAFLGRTPPPGDALTTLWRQEPSRGQLQGRVSLLHCTTEYPCPEDQVNLRAMDTLRQTFGLRTGYSDHTQGIEVPMLAVARGATIIEKHFTLDRRLPGPDHAASLEPDELVRMVEAIRRTERVLGSPEKRLSPVEAGNREVARKSLVALQPIAVGEPFGPHNLGTKRPGTGRSPFDYWKLLGQPAPRAYQADELIE
jgi:N-acetylneuraminate synthase